MREDEEPGRLPRDAERLADRLDGRLAWNAPVAEIGDELLAGQPRLGSD